MDVFTPFGSGPLRAHLRLAATQAGRRLGLYPRLRERPWSAGELARELGLPEEHRLLALLDVLALEGIASREGESFSLRHLPAGAAALEPAGWGLLDQVLRRGQPLDEPGVAGEGDPEALRRFHEHLRNAGREPALELADELARRSSRPAPTAEAGGPQPLLLDLGAGAGVYAQAWLERNPRARAALIDRPAVLERAAGALRDAGVLERAELLSRELLDAAPWPACDAALLANLLHLFGPDDARALVARAARAVRPGGAVVIKDLRLDDDRRGPPEGLFFSLNMGLFTQSGRVHTDAALRSFLAGAALEEIELTTLRCSPESRVAIGRVPEASPPP